MTPVRVCFAIDALGRAGTETQLLALIRGLDRRRVEPSLVLLDGTSDDSRLLEPVDCPILRLGVTRLVSPRAARAAVRFAEFVRVHRPDVLQAYFLDAAYFTVPVAKSAGVRRVVRVRNNLGYWLTPKHRLLNRLLRPLVDATLTNSAAGRDALIAADGLAPGRVAVIENGVDLDRFACFPPPTGARIGCVANLRPVKNVAGLIRAAAVVCERFPHATFAIAGDGEQRAELERLRDSLGLAGRVAFRGSVADVPAFLRGIDVAVLPSHSEGMSNALLEYMAAGRAVVATDVGANRRLLGDAGAIVPPSDDAALAVGLAGILADPESATRLGAAARFRAADFGRAAMVRQFEEFYTDLAAGRPGKASTIPGPAGTIGAAACLSVRPRRM